MLEALKHAVPVALRQREAEGVDVPPPPGGVPDSCSEGLLLCVTVMLCVVERVMQPLLLRLGEALLLRVALLLKVLLAVGSLDSERVMEEEELRLGLPLVLPLPEPLPEAL